MPVPLVLLVPESTTTNTGTVAGQFPLAAVASSAGLDLRYYYCTELLHTTVLASTSTRASKLRKDENCSCPGTSTGTSSTSTGNWQ
jgi:hypothetical protein